MWAPLGTLVPLGTLTGRALAARALSPLLRPAEGRPGPRRRAEGAGGGRGAGGGPREEKNMAPAAEGSGALGRAGRQ